MRQLLHLTKALADPSRIRILCALAERGELCVCQIHELLALAPSTTSKHLSQLAAAGLLVSRKEARWVHYRLARGAEAPAAATELIGWLRARAAEEPAIAADRARLDRILIFSPEELCARQGRGESCCGPGIAPGAASDCCKSDAPAAPQKRPTKSSRKKS